MEDKVIEKKTITLADNQIVVDKDKLADMLGRLEKLEKKNTKPVIKPVGQKTATVAFYDGKAVVGLGAFSSTLNQLNNEVLRIDLTLQDNKGKESTETVIYTDFLKNAERKRGKIIGTEVETIVDQISNDIGMPIEVEKAYVKDYSTMGTGIKIPVVVNSVKHTYKIEFEDGQTINIKEDYVNI